MVNGDDSSLEKLSQPISNDNPPIKWSTALGPPQSPEHTILLLLKVCLQLRHDFIFDHLKVTFSIQIPIKEAGSQKCPISTKANPKGNLLPTDVYVIGKGRWFMQWCIFADIPRIDSAIHEKCSFIPDNKMFKESWMLVKQPTAKLKSIRKLVTPFHFVRVPSDVQTHNSVEGRQMEFLNHSALQRDEGSFQAALALP